MKKMILFLFTSFLLLSSYAVWADCGGGGCGFSGCNPYETTCQCADPACNNPWDSDCISRSYCCEAFGNVGGR